MSPRLLLSSAIALSCAAPFAVFACINVMGTDVSGRQVDADACTHDLPEVLSDPKVRREWREQVLRDIERDAAAAPSFENRNDLAAAALHVGQLERAYNLLAALEEEEPGHYEVAANLGTALELLGRDAEARDWIARGIERNVDNHFGTEWLHLRILDAKLALATNPTWTDTHTVLGIDFGQEDAPAKRVHLPNGNDGKLLTEPKAVQLGICYQMMERLPFTRAPDPVVGSLLFDAGNLAFHHDTLENALKLYQLAAEYTVADAALLERRMAHTRQLLERLAPKAPLRQAK